jgi:hypothetical protein
MSSAPEGACPATSYGGTMGIGVVSIRVEALGVSITIADGSIAIEQTRPETSAAANWGDLARYTKARSRSWV